MGFKQEKKWVSFWTKDHSIRNFALCDLRLRLHQKLWERFWPGRSCPSEWWGLRHSPFTGPVFGNELCSWASFRVKAASCSGSLLRFRFGLPEGCCKLVHDRNRRLLVWADFQGPAEEWYPWHDLPWFLLNSVPPDMPLPGTLTVEWWSCLWNSLLQLPTHLSFTRGIKPLSISPADMAPCLLQPPATPINRDALLAKSILAHFLSWKFPSLLRAAALPAQSCAHQYPSRCAFYAKPSFGLIIRDCRLHSGLRPGSSTGHPSSERRWVYFQWQKPPWVLLPSNQSYLSH